VCCADGDQRGVLYTVQYYNYEKTQAARLAHFQAPQEGCVYNFREGSLDYIENREEIAQFWALKQTKIV
jgi:hypothetical protein